MTAANKPTIRVVLIEDDPMVQEVNRMFIERVEDFQVIAIARTGAEGIRLTRELSPDLVFLDIFMPVLDGLETLRQLRLADTPVDVIAVTAAKDPETIQSMMRGGVFDYIIKPFKFERVQETLQRYRLHRESFAKNEPFTQAELDSLLRSGPAGFLPPRSENGQATLEVAQHLLPKGLNAITLKQIFAYMLKQNRLLSAEEVADGVGIARVTARRYLDYLEKQGLIALDIHYGGVGRPVNRYKPTADQKDQK
ncbi:response regulator [Paenibacillus thailandensis]|uniref:Transcriptional regulatory protein n=1 Tax=Paenibacillus thailandensis TaxID=393250 RepID=A0ABW5R441_9BACL